MSIISPALIVTGILCFIALTTIANDQNTLKFTKIACQKHDDMISNYTCRIKPVSRYVSLLNVSGYLNQQLDNISATIRFYKKMDTNAYRPFLINVTENVCQVFVNQYRVPYSNILRKIAAPYTNLNHSCPYYGNILKLNTNLPMDASKLPSLCPTGEYRIDVFVMANNRRMPSITTLVYLEIGQKRFG